MGELGSANLLFAQSFEVKGERVLCDCSGTFPLREFLANTRGGNLTGIVTLTWPSRWSCFHCGVGPFGDVTSFAPCIIVVLQFSTMTSPWRGTIRETNNKEATPRKVVNIAAEAV